MCVCVKLLYVTFVYVKLLYVKFVCVCVKFVYVKLLYVKFVLPLDHEQNQHLAGSVRVCVWNATGRQKKESKHAKIKHAEKHAGRTASSIATDQTYDQT